LHLCQILHTLDTRRGTRQPPATPPARVEPTLPGRAGRGRAEDALRLPGGAAPPSGTTLAAGPGAVDRGPPAPVLRTTVRARCLPRRRNEVIGNSLFALQALHRGEL